MILARAMVCVRWAAYAMLTAVAAVIAWRLIHQEWEEVVDFLRVCMWPLVVLAALIVLRRPIAAFLESISGRVNKLSVFNVEVELSAASSTRPLELPTLELFKAPSAEALGGDSTGDLFRHIAKETTADFAIVDLGAGSEWLTSRLFILACLLPRMRGIRAIVFLAHRGGTDRTFLGSSSPEEVRWRLAMAYPWLELQFEESLVSASPHLRPAVNAPGNESYVKALTGAIDTGVATRTLVQFIKGLQNVGGPVGSGWIRLNKPDGELRYWERAAWLDVGLLDQVLGASLNRAWIAEDPSVGPNEYTARTLRLSGRFVGQVDRFGAFRNLIDRSSLVEQVATAVARQSTP
jgi:hypothetical protein